MDIVQTVIKCHFLTFVQVCFLRKGEELFIWWSWVEDSIWCPNIWTWIGTHTKWM